MAEVDGELESGESRSRVHEGKSDSAAISIAVLVPYATHTTREK
jgi:hypothetical protein